MNPAIQIAIITAAAITTAIIGARRLDNIEQQQNHEYELRDAKARATRAELDLLNDGSWPAFWKEHRAHLYAIALSEPGTSTDQRAAA